MHCGDFIIHMRVIERERGERGWMHVDASPLPYVSFPFSRVSSHIHVMLYHSVQSQVAEWHQRKRWMPACFRGEMRSRCYLGGRYPRTGS